MAKFIMIFLIIVNIVALMALNVDSVKEQFSRINITSKELKYVFIASLILGLIILVFSSMKILSLILIIVSAIGIILLIDISKLMSDPVQDRVKEETNK